MVYGVPPRPACYHGQKRQKKHEFREYRTPFLVPLTKPFLVWLTLNAFAFRMSLVEQFLFGWFQQPISSLCSEIDSLYGFLVKMLTM